MTEGIKDKIIVLTGASSGLGEATARLNVPRECLEAIRAAGAKDECRPLLGQESRRRLA